MIQKRMLAALAVIALSCVYIDGLSQSYLPLRNSTVMKVPLRIGLRAYAFNLNDVQLLEGSPFKHAMDMDEAYMLALSPDRLLHRFFKNAGLPVKDSIYGGWENEGLSGHTLGHYLSACAMMYASTGNSTFKTRVSYIVGELGRCQAARKTGYVGAIPKEDSIFYKVQRGDIKSGGFDLNGGWSPWYTVHKVMAGLVDAYLYCNIPQALAIVKDMADWTGTIINPLTPEQLQKMLKCEYGGMSDVLAIIYSLTGDHKYLDLSYKFYDDVVMLPLSEQKNPLAGKHSNTNIPKAIGSARQYELTGNTRDETIASFFWQQVVQHHTYVTGGNGNYEYFGEPGKLNNSLSDNTAETCCAYNMLKLTGHLFTWQPSAGLADYYERTLYNDILASQHPKTGMTLYFEPLRMGSKKQFSDSFNTFTCCVGSGMENHAKYTEAIYFEGADGSLYVNLFIPSKLSWKSRKTTITQTTSYPETTGTKLTINPTTSQPFTIRIRQPWWAASATVRVNGKLVIPVKDTTGYLSISRKWRKGDVVDAGFPMHLYTEAMPDNADRVAVMYGPLVLAGNLGTTQPDPVYGTPVLLTDNHDVRTWAVPDSSRPLVFHSRNTAKPFDVELSPFYKNTDNYYSVYWDYFTSAAWAARQAEYEAEKKHQQEIETQTIDIMRLGEMQPERDHRLRASDNSYTSDAFGRTGREARSPGFFSFHIKVQQGVPNTLLCTYIGDDKNRSFDILIDSVKIASVELKGGATGKFFDVEYPIPAALIEGKTSVEVMVQSTNGKTAGRMFGCRVIRTMQ
ncbi:MAG: beta-L-arabinofuranosidase domain-containing protein [Bacteroidota bacterium]